MNGSISLQTDQIKTITDIRTDIKSILREVKKDGMYFIFNHNKPEAALMSIEKLNSLQELIEDLQDQIDAYEINKDDFDKSDYDSLDNMKKELGL